MTPFAITRHIHVIEAPYGIAHRNRSHERVIAYDVVAKVETRDSVTQILLVRGLESKLEAEHAVSLIRSAMTQNGDVPDELTPMRMTPGMLEDAS